jgi:hypothetical protein
MKSVNLIPAPRLVAKRRRLHLRRCAVGCAVWAVMSATAAGATHVMWRTAMDPQAQERLAQVEDEIERTDRAIGTARAQLAAAQSTLRANEAISNQPDWGVLLAVLAQSIKEDVVLKSCHVHPAGRRGDARRAPAAAGTSVTSATSGGGAEAVPFVLDANGMAKDLEAAHRFVDELEKTGLFARVTLLDTSREPFINSDAIAFHLSCSLDEPTAATAPDGAQAAIDKRE